jgi:hypothetical protein
VLNRLDLKQPVELIIKEDHPSNRRVSGQDRQMHAIEGPEPNVANQNARRMMYELVSGILKRGRLCNRVPHLA